MTNLMQLEKTFSKNLLTKKEKSSLKGKGMGNMNQAGKKCPPPVDEGKKEIKAKFL